MNSLTVFFQYMNRELVRRKQIITPLVICIVPMIAFLVDWGAVATADPTPMGGGPEGVIEPVEFTAGLFFSFTGFFGTLAAIILGCSVVSAELNRGMLAMWSTRPVRRIDVLLGRFFAVALVLVLSSLLWGSILALAALVRGGGGEIAGQLLLGSIGLIPTLITFLAVATLYSNWLGSLGSAGVALATWLIATILGWVASFDEAASGFGGELPDAAQAVATLGELATWILPTRFLDDWPNVLAFSGDLEPAALAALATPVIWLALACLFLQRRRNLH